MSSYYNNIPIEEYINIEYANVDTINASTVKTQNLYIDNIKSSDKVITQNLTLDTDNIESLSKASTAPYTSDNNKITSKGYVDEALSGKASTSDLVGQKYYVEGELKGEIFNDYDNNEASGLKSHCEGSSNKATGNWSHCEGGSNKATSYYCHTEGGLNKSTGYASHCEGYNNEANGQYSHCEGSSNTVSGDYSHCEGQSNTISTTRSHCEGYGNLISGDYAHCEGHTNRATANCTHAGGLNNYADQFGQTAIGKYNTTSNTNALLSVGNGTAHNARSDALVVKSTGEVIINSTATDTTPKLTIGTSKSIIGTTALSSSTQTDDDKLATKYYVDNLFSNIPLYTTYSIRIRMYKNIHTYFIFDYDYKGIIIVDDYKLIITGECYVEDFSSLTSDTGFNLIIDYIKYNNVYYYEGIGYGTENPNNLSSSTHNISNGKNATLYLQNTPNIQPKSGRLTKDDATPVDYIPSTRKWFIFNNSIFYHY